MKICPKCGYKLADSNFFTDLTTSDNLSYYCKKCIVSYFKQYQGSKRKG